MFELFVCSRSGPNGYCWEFFIHSYSLSTNNKAQEGCLGDMELTFFCFDEEMQWRSAPEQVVELIANISEWIKGDHASLVRISGLRPCRKAAFKQSHSSYFLPWACGIWAHTLHLTFSIAWWWITVHQSLFLWGCDQKLSKKFNETIIWRRELTTLLAYSGRSL